MRGLVAVLAYLVLAFLFAPPIGRLARSIGCRYRQARDDREFGPLAELPARARVRMTGRVVRIETRRRSGR